MLRDRVIRYDIAFSPQQDMSQRLRVVIQTMEDAQSEP